jgi:ABC-type sugar transport system ATPase subunit
MSNIVEIKNLTYKYDQRKTDGITNISLRIKQGKVLSLIGPSGSGKTTTLKSLAGILPISSGEINFIENVKMAYVDQHPKLDEEKTVYENLDLDLLWEIPDPEKRSNQIRTTLAFLEITNEINSQLQSISGGQRQRVIIAMALIHNPTLLLLDEPFANLDKTLRTQLLNELFDLLIEKDITVVWVTHNTEEALAYSHEIALLNYGKLQQIGSPQDLYNRPENLFTAQFFNEVNLIPAKRISTSETQITVNFFNKEFILTKPKNFVEKDHHDVLVVARPEHLILDHSSKFKGKINKKIFRGSTTLIEFTYKDYILNIEVPSSEVPNSSSILFSFKTELLFCLSEV